ncbi:MAG: hypothetical protein ICV78_20435 [Tolypothrix sp. Co-bin9]|nr:hypothetical protein [Tolypothrix sp. Co-bin9]
MPLLEGLTPSGKKRAVRVTEDGDFNLGQNQQQVNTNNFGEAPTDVTGPSTGSGPLKFWAGIWDLLNKLSVKIPNHVNNKIPVALESGTNTADKAATVTLASNGIFAVFAGLADDLPSVIGSIHGKLRAIAEPIFSDWNRLQNARDLSITYTYNGAGTVDERINTIVYASQKLGFFITETYSYEGTTGALRIATVVRS